MKAQEKANPLKQFRKEEIDDVLLEYGLITKEQQAAKKAERAAKKKNKGVVA